MSCLLLCAACTDAPPVSQPVVVLNACPRVSLCPMPGSDPLTNGDLSADIRQLETALESCALQVETIKACQDKTDVQTEESAQRLN
ncbi:Rz1-like lysis system protein LysC [Pseudescherichia vulneris]